MERLGRLEHERDTLRNALIGLVGVSESEELKAMEGAVRVMGGIPEQDRVNTLNAIHALIDTDKK